MLDENKLRKKLESLNYEEIKELAFLMLRSRELSRLRKRRQLDREKREKKGK